MLAVLAGRRRRLPPPVMCGLMRYKIDVVSCTHVWITELMSMVGLGAHIGLQPADHNMV